MGLFDKKGVQNGDKGFTFDGKRSGSTSDGTMGDVIAWTPNSNDELVFKYHYNNIKQGARIVVHETQVALVYFQGQYSELLTAAKAAEYRFDFSPNIPFFDKILNAAHNGSTPYFVEVWFFNMTTERKMLWGIGGNSTIVHDSSVNLDVPIAANGDYALKIDNPLTFARKLIGTLHNYDTEDMFGFINSNVLEKITPAFVDVCNRQEKFAIRDLNTSAIRQELRDTVKRELNNELLSDYGIEITQFNIRAVDLSEYDKLQAARREAFEMTAGLREYGDISYAQQMLDATKMAASNEGAGAMMGFFGMNMATMQGNGMMGNRSGAVHGAVPPPIPSAASIYVAVNGTQQGPFDIEQIRQMIVQQQVLPTTLVWMNGMESWAAASTVAAIAGLFTPVVPPIPNQQ